MSTEKKVAVITGASSGMGAGILQAFRDRNYRVVATSRSIRLVELENLRATVTHIVATWK